MSWKVIGGKHKGKDSRDLTYGQLYAVWSWHRQNQPGDETDVMLAKELERRGLPVSVPEWVMQPRPKSQLPASAMATPEKIRIQRDSVICPVCGRDKRKERKKKEACCGWVTMQTGWIGKSEAEIPAPSGSCPF